MRALLDVNVLVAAALSPNGTPALVVTAWLRGAYELVVSPLLLAELEHTLAYPKLRAHISADDATALVDFLRYEADLRDDPDVPPPVASSDPDDDYLIALAASAQAALVSGDRHLLDLSDRIPVRSPREFLDFVER